MPDGKKKKAMPPFYDLISPKQAEAWLSHNTGNRPLNESLVAEYARKMESGEWKEKGGAPIWVTEDGELVNGQHRLSAVIRVGHPVLLKVQIREKPPVSWQEWHNRRKDLKRKN